MLQFHNRLLLMLSERAGRLTLSERVGQSKRQPSRVGERLRYVIERFPGSPARDSQSRHFRSNGNTRSIIACAHSMQRRQRAALDAMPHPPSSGPDLEAAQHHGLQRRLLLVQGADVMGGSADAALSSRVANLLRALRVWSRRCLLLPAGCPARLCMRCPEGGQLRLMACRPPARA